jgi:hypothetical protein
MTSNALYTATFNAHKDGAPMTTEQVDQIEASLEETRRMIVNDNGRCGCEFALRRARTEARDARIRIAAMVAAYRSRVAA